jgi:hypothetical protein
MEFTLASAFSQEGRLGHSAHALLVLSMLMRTLLWLRRRDGIVEMNRLVSVGGVPDRRPT